MVTPTLRRFVTSQNLQVSQKNSLHSSEPDLGLCVPRVTARSDRSLTTTRTLFTRKRVDSTPWKIG